MTNFQFQPFLFNPTGKAPPTRDPSVFKKKKRRKKKRKRFLYSYLRLLGIYCLQKALTLEQQHPRQLAPINRLEQLENDFRDDGMNAAPVPKICLTNRIRTKESHSDTHSDTHTDADTNASA